MNDLTDMDTFHSASDGMLLDPEQALDGEGQYNDPDDYLNYNGTDAMQPDSSQFAKATVEGAGMWKSWTRSFNKPIMAMLDLFDNAIDACLQEQDLQSSKSRYAQSQTPIITVQSDLSVHKLTDAKAHRNGRNGNGGEAAASDSGNPTGTSDRTKARPTGEGVLMMNSSVHPIPPMAQILTVYRSSKQNDSEIGENGVGIKQACAHLSDVSIICTKSSSTKFGLGVLSKDLQKKEPNLPSVQLPDGSMSQSMPSATKVLTDLAARHPQTFGSAFRSYGSSEQTTSNGEAVRLGAEKVAKVFECITQRDEWKDHPHVFVLIMCNLRHQGQVADTFEIRESTGGANADKDAVSEVSLIQTKISASARLLEELERELPMRYLHVPLHFHIQVQWDRIEFQYWERRLVELTRFDVMYSKITPFQKMQNWWHLEQVLADIKEGGDANGNGKQLESRASLAAANAKKADEDAAVPQLGNGMKDGIQDLAMQDSDGAIMATPEPTIKQRPLKKMARKTPSRRCSPRAPVPVAKYHQEEAIEAPSDPPKVIKKAASPKRAPRAPLKPMPPPNPKTISQMRIWCGFDPIRASSKTSAASMYLYSRTSGRLIKYSKDCRAELGLVTSGSEFAQGLTVIIDDLHGTLPLNPTKQDVAFGLEAHGETHETNMQAWVGGCTHTYWRFYADRLGTKTNVAKAVCQQLPKIKSLVERSTTMKTRKSGRMTVFPQLSTGSFLRFDLLGWNQKLGVIRCPKSKRDRLIQKDGKDCAARVDFEKALLSDDVGNGDEDGDYDSSSEAPRTPKKRKSTPRSRKRKAANKKQAAAIPPDIVDLLNDNGNLEMDVFADDTGRSSGRTQAQWKSQLQQRSDANKELQATIRERDERIKALEEEMKEHSAKKDATLAKAREYRRKYKEEQRYCQEMLSTERQTAERCRGLHQENMRLMDKVDELKRICRKNKINIRGDLSSDDDDLYDNDEGITRAKRSTSSGANTNRKRRATRSRSRSSSRRASSQPVQNAPSFSDDDSDDDHDDDDDDDDSVL